MGYISLFLHLEKRRGREKKEKNASKEEIKRGHRQGEGPLHLYRILQRKGGKGLASCPLERGRKKGIQ